VFVGRPEAVVAGVARAVKKVGCLSCRIILTTEGVRITPNCEIFQRVFSMVARSWRRRGGNPDIGAEIPRYPGTLRFRGEGDPADCARRPAGSPLWQWPETFFANYLPTLWSWG